MLWVLGKVGLVPSSMKELTPVQALALGLAAGLCEETARALMLRPMKQARDGASSVMFGLGHGGIEAMLLGGVLLAAQYTAMSSLDHTDLAGVARDAAQVGALKEQFAALQRSPALVLVSVLERVMALGAQLTLSLLVMLSLRTRKPAWFLAAVGYHTLIDSCGVFASRFTSGPLETEGVVFLLIAPGVAWWFWQLRRLGWGAPRRARPVFAAEWARFQVVLRKELRQPWRTGGAWIVLVVFALSALLAPAVPLTLKLIPPEVRAKMAASGFDRLIPASSAGFALD